MDITLSEPRHRLWDAVTAELQTGGWEALSGLSLTLLQLAQKNLLALRQALADPQQPRVDWTNPWIEAQYPVEWSWERHFALLSEPPPRQRFRNQYLAEWARELGHNGELRVFHYLTRGVAVLVRGDSYRPLVPRKPREELRDLSEPRRREGLERLLREPLFRDNSQRLAIEVGGRLHEVTVVRRTGRRPSRPVSGNRCSMAPRRPSASWYRPRGTRGCCRRRRWRCRMCCPSRGSAPYAPSPCPWGPA